MLNCSDVDGSARYVSLAVGVGVISCKDYELKRESKGRENVRGEKKY